MDKLTKDELYTLIREHGLFIAKAYPLILVGDDDIIAAAERIIELVKVASTK